jgi:hypothetical protein
MSRAILPGLATALLLRTTALASAQTAGPYVPYSAWQDPYAGAPYYGVAPYNSFDEPDRYGGMAWEGIAPYAPHQR